MEVQKLCSLGMGWAWYVNDLSTYLSDADTPADMTPVGNTVMGVSPDIPLSDIDLEPEEVPVPDAVDNYIANMLFSTCPSRD